MINKSAHGHSLFFSTTQDIIPVTAVFPSSFSVTNVCKSNLLEDLHKHIIGGTSSSGFLNAVWINKLVSEVSSRQVWSLWDIENLIQRWLVEDTTGDWPELSHDSEEGTLTTSVWTSDEKMHTWFDLEVHFCDQNITVWRKNWNVDEFKAIADNNFTLVAHVNKFKLLRWRTILGNLSSSELTSVQVLEDLVHFMDKRCVTSEVLDILIRNYDSTNCLGKVDEKSGVSNVILSDDVGIVVDTLEVCFFTRSENWKTADTVTNGDSSVLDKDCIEDTHHKSLVKNVFDVIQEFSEFIIDLSLFPVATVIESDLFRVVKKISLLSSVLTFDFLLDSGQFTESWSDDFDAHGGDEIPGNDSSWTSPPNKFGQFLGEKNNIQNGFSNIQVEA